MATPMTYVGPSFSSAKARVLTFLIVLGFAATLDAQTPATPALEKAAAAALTQEPAPTPFPIEVYPVSVPMPGHPGLAGVYVTIPGGGLTSAGNPKTGMYTAGAL